MIAMHMGGRKMTAQEETTEEKDCLAPVEMIGSWENTKHRGRKTPAMTSKLYIGNIIDKDESPVEENK